MHLTHVSSSIAICLVSYQAALVHVHITIVSDNTDVDASVSIVRQYCHEIISARNYTHIDKRYRATPSRINVHLQEDISDIASFFGFSGDLKENLGISL